MEITSYELTLEAKAILKLLDKEVIKAWKEGHTDDYEEVAIQRLLGYEQEE